MLKPTPLPTSSKRDETIRSQIVNVDTKNMSTISRGADGAAPTRRSASSARGLPLAVALLFQCVLVVAGFVALTVATSLMMDIATKRLLEQSVSGDLRYARANILAPVHTYEKILLGLRDRYLTYKAVNDGREMCGDESLNLSTSRDFFIEGMSIMDNNPLAQAVFHLRWSDTFIRADNGLPDLTECDTAPDYLMYVHNGSNRFSDAGVPLQQIKDLGSGSLDTIPHHDVPVDFYYEAYVEPTMAFTALAWEPMVLYDSGTDTTGLYLAVYAPMAITRTVSDGSGGTMEESYTPDLSIPTPVKRDPTLKTTSILGMSITMADFQYLIAAITPNADGAHTTIYDMAMGMMLCTSDLNAKLFDPVSASQYPAGRTLSPHLNKAYEEAANDVRAFVNAPPRYASLEDDPRTDVAIRFEKDAVVATIGIETISGVRFAVVQSIPKAYYFGPVTRLRTIMIIVGVVAAVAVVAVCVLVSVSILLPLQKVEANMQLAAQMKNDRVVPTTSYISEVNAMCGAFDRMNDKLLQARAFMPQALLDGDTTGEDDDGDGEEEEMGVVRATDGQSKVGGDRQSVVSLRHAASMSAASSTLKQSAVGNDNNTHATSDYAKGGRGLARRDAASNVITTKRVTILVINGRGFHKTANVSVPATIAPCAQELTTFVGNVCTQQRGVVDSFHGDHFVLSFNATKANAQGPAKAMRAAEEIALSQPFDKPMAFSMGASVGRACVGHLGSATMKRLSIIGTVYSKASALERLCKTHRPCAGVPQCGFACFVDSAMAREVAQSVPSLVVGAAVGEPFVDAGSDATYEPIHNVISQGEGGKSVKLHQSGDTEADEWLYEVARLDSKERTLKDVNSAVIQLLNTLYGSPLSPAAEEDAANLFASQLAAIRADADKSLTGQIAVDYATSITQFSSLRTTRKSLFDLK